MRTRRAHGLQPDPGTVSRGIEWDNCPPGGTTTYCEVEGQTVIVEDHLGLPTQWPVDYDLVESGDYASFKAAAQGGRRGLQEYMLRQCENGELSKSSPVDCQENRERMADRKARLREVQRLALQEPAPRRCPARTQAA